VAPKLQQQKLQNQTTQPEQNPNKNTYKFASMTHTSTRVFKKSSQNGKITTYLGKRDFIDHVDHTESIDGIVLLDPDYVNEVPGRKVLATLSCVFRYGREDLDVLGLTFRRDLYSVTQQVWPSSFNFNKSSENNKTDQESAAGSTGKSSTQNDSSKVTTNPNLQTGAENEKTGADSVHSTVVANPNSKNNSAGANKGNLDTLTISPCQQPDHLTQLQVRLKRKLGNNAFPLYFKIPPNCPCSITLQPAPGDTGKPCGIDYELKTWILEPNATSFQNTISPSNFSPENNNNNNSDGKSNNKTSTNNAQQQPNLEGILPSQYLPDGSNHVGPNNPANNQGVNGTHMSTALQNASGKSSTVKLAIRKIQYAPIVRGPQPQADTKQTFWLSEKPVHMEATLDKDLYHHGEKIYVNVQITNNSSKSVKKIKVSVRQFADVCLYSYAQYKCVVASFEAGDQVGSSQTLCKVYEICPLLAQNRDKRGLALDGQLKHEDTNLASSTIQKPDVSKEGLGIIVQYKVKVKAVMSGMLPGMDSDISVELPFKLMHSRPPPKQRKPTETSVPSKELAQLNMKKTESDAQSVNLISFESSERINTAQQQGQPQQFSSQPNNPAAAQTQQTQPTPGKQGGAPEDFIFEEFARNRHLQTQNSQDELK